MKDIKINSYTGFQRLKSCIVGKSYPPEFYDTIENPGVRDIMKRVARETEEDYQKLIKIIEDFGATVYRPEIDPTNNFDRHLIEHLDGIKRYQPPPMSPRDHLLVYGNTMLVDRPTSSNYHIDFYQHIVDRIDGVVHLSDDNHILREMEMPSVTRVGKDVYFDDLKNGNKIRKQFFSDCRTHEVLTHGHSDGVFCPVTPGLIVSLHDVPTYKDTFPGWEVVFLPDQSWKLVNNWLDLKQRNGGKWWIPGEEKNDDLIDYVETWLTDWVGYVEETVFDVNMFVLDEKNVVVNNYNKRVFEALERHGVTPHICNFRHRYFWDGGLHCITLDLEREGDCVDYFK
mgnify:CR=1 FL=1